MALGQSAVNVVLLLVFLQASLTACQIVWTAMELSHLTLLHYPANPLIKCSCGIFVFVCVVYKYIQLLLFKYSNTTHSLQIDVG